MFVRQHKLLSLQHIHNCQAIGREVKAQEKPVFVTKKILMRALINQDLHK